LDRPVLIPASATCTIGGSIPASGLPCPMT
jgi:hypothetical protein